jgi:hypothetical protein
MNLLEGKEEEKDKKNRENKVTSRNHIKAIDKK